MTLPDPIAPAPPRPYVGLIGLVMLVAAGKSILGDTMDPDAFWHLRVADQLLSDGIGPLVDSISFASDKTPWTPYSWAAELLMKGVWDVAGYRGSILVTAFCSAAIVWFTALACFEATRRRAAGGSALTTAVAAVLASYFTLAYISFRPVTFALALMAVMVWLLWRDRRAPSRWLWAVPAIVGVMTNLHLYAVVAAGVTVLFAMGTYFDDRPQFVRRAIVALLSVAAACCTPMLPGMIDTALRYNAEDPMVAADFISEMRPFYAGLDGKITLAIVTALVAWTIVQRRRLGLIDWLLLVAGLVLIVRLGRFAPLFALISVPVFAVALPPLNDRTLRRVPVRVAVVAVIGLGLANLAWSFPGRQVTFDQWLNRNVDVASGYPTAAADFAAKLPARTKRCVNEFNWGGYLAWRLGEPWQVLMGGRTQLYSSAFWHATYLRPAPDEAYLASIDADFALLPLKNSRFAKTLKRLGWEVVYQDDVAVVLVRKD